MTGYWKETILSGFKTGPYRTSLSAIDKYHEFFDDPKKYCESSKDSEKYQGTFLHPKHISGMTYVPKSKIIDKRSKPIIIISLGDTESQEFAKNNHKNAKDILENIVKIKNNDAYNLYKDYELHCWIIDSTKKAKKWQLENIKKENASSLETTFKKFNKSKNLLMIYYNIFNGANELILNAWNGTLNLSEDPTDFESISDSENEEEIDDSSDDEGVIVAGGAGIVNWNSYTVKQLRAECRRLGLKVSGVKSELVKRLEEN